MISPEAERAMPSSIVRSVVSGCLIGAVLCICNVYSGLKVGFSSNMGVTAALLAFAVWRLRTRRAIARSPFGILETNLAQTAASSTAAVSSAGLVAAIPALTIMTGFSMSWFELTLWLLAVVLIGNVIAIPIGRRMIVTDPLPFPMGLATAETLRQIYAKGQEAMARVLALGVSAVVAGGVKALESFKVLTPTALPGSLGGYKLFNLTFAFDPALLLVGIGGLMGLRVSLSVLAGSVLAYGVLGAELLARGMVAAGPADKPWFKPLVEWLLWPGVTLMVVSSLTTLALSWRVLVRGIVALKNLPSADASPDAIPQSWFTRGAIFVTALAVALQIWFFSIPWWAALLGVLMSAVLAVVAARVAGETGLVPIGAMGKVTQLTVGAALPGDVAANLMTANVTGGSASQCADMMNDLKTGHELGASPRAQWLSQVAGAVTGAFAGAAVYRLMIPDPARQLITTEWPAPAVITWKTVAEIFRVGIDALPPGTPAAIAVAAAFGVLLAVLEAKLPENRRKWVPSPAAIGLSFTISANQCLSLFVGGMLAVAVARWAPKWHGRFWVVLCAGVVAGEGLTGAGLSVHQMLGDAR